MYFANLPWYDFPAIRAATDPFWSCLANNLRQRGFSSVPATLDRITPYRRQWTSGNLLFGQCCGYDAILPPYAEHLRILATPVYAAAGCQGACYSSLVLVREDSPAQHMADLCGTRCVINEANSHSGMNALRAMIAPMHRNGRFFSKVVVSGSHECSLEMMGGKEADVAAIDCVTYALIQRGRPQLLSGLRTLGRTGHAPAPPYVVSARLPDRDVAKIRAALLDTLDDPVIARARSELLLDAVELMPLESYRPIVQWQSEAVALGYAGMSFGPESCFLSQARIGSDSSRI